MHDNDLCMQPRFMHAARPNFDFLGCRGRAWHIHVKLPYHRYRTLVMSSRVSKRRREWLQTACTKPRPPAHGSTFVHTYQDYTFLHNNNLVARRRPAKASRSGDVSGHRGTSARDKSIPGRVMQSSSAAALSLNSAPPSRPCSACPATAEHCLSVRCAHPSSVVFRSP